MNLEEILLAGAPRSVIFTGSRDYDDHFIVAATMLGVAGFGVEAHGHLTIIHGAAAGLDSIVDEVAAELREEDPRIIVDAHPADWPTCEWTHPSVPCPPGTQHRKTRKDRTEYCPLAGFRRNQEMADLRADLCVAFVNKPLAESKGTNDMCERAAKMGTKIHVVTTGGRP